MSWRAMRCKSCGGPLRGPLDAIDGLCGGLCFTLFLADMGSRLKFGPALLSSTEQYTVMSRRPEFHVLMDEWLERGGLNANNRLTPRRAQSNSQASLEPN